MSKKGRINNTHPTVQRRDKLVDIYTLHAQFGHRLSEEQGNVLISEAWKILGLPEVEDAPVGDSDTAGDGESEGVGSEPDDGASAALPSDGTEEWLSDLTDSAGSGTTDVAAKGG